MSSIYVHGGDSTYYYEEPKIKLTYTAKATRSGTTVTVEFSELKLERADSDIWFGYNIWVYVSPNNSKNSSKDILLIERDVGTPDGSNAYWSAITKSETVKLTISDVPVSQDRLTVYFKTAAPCSSNCNGGNAAHPGTSSDIGVTSGRYVGDRLPVDSHTFTGLKSEVTISWNANGGSSVSSTKKTPGSSMGTLPSTSRTGYTFQGWYTAESGGTQITTSTTVPASNTTYYAHWRKNILTLYFHANGGSIKEEKLSEYTINSYGYIHNVDKGSRHIQQWSYNDAKTDTGLPNPTTFGLYKTGYNFNLWGTSETGGTTFDPDDTGLLPTEINSGISSGDVEDYLYALWTAKTFTVTFNANGGSCTTASKSVTYDSNYGTLPTPTLSGHTFDGWYTSASGGTKVTSSTKVSITANQTLYAHWDTNSYTVTLNANGGSVSPSSLSVTYGAKYGTLPTPARSGYRFDGWFTSASGGTEKTATDTYNTAGDSTLYAHWTLVEFTLTFDANGGSVSPASKKVTYGSAYGTLPTPTRQWYRFDGWFTTKTGSVQKTASSTYQLLSDSTLYAHWTRLTYTLTFAPNGISWDSEDLPEAITEYQGVSITIPSMFPDRSGYTFGGWGDKQTSPTKIYRPGDTYSEYDANATLYAIWNATSYTVTFDLKGGTSTGGTLVQTVRHGQNATPPSNPTKPNKTFKGWLGNYKNVTSNRTITAMWDSSPIWIMTNTGWKPYYPSGE